MDDLIERLEAAINSNSIGNGKIVVQSDLLEDTLELLKAQKEKPCDNCQEFVCDGCKYANG